jgi:hypothetical protein
VGADDNYQWYTEEQTGTSFGIASQSSHLEDYISQTDDSGPNNYTRNAFPLGFEWHMIICTPPAPAETTA